tara:strand:- start:531 stop:773 length:243 start_codon:yes stop_codon:yes gene_type:complete
MGAFLIMIKEIDRVPSNIIKKIYRNIIEKISFKELKEMRTENYWKERDQSFSQVGKMEVTIEFYIKYSGTSLKKLIKQYK